MLVMKIKVGRVYIIQRELCLQLCIAVLYIIMINRW